MDKQAPRGPVGRRFPREDAEAKIKGQLRFLTDIRMEGMLHARQVPGRLPHARLLGLKLDAARSAPGVVAVISAAEVPGENRVGVIIDDQPLLADGKVLEVGCGPCVRDDVRLDITAAVGDGKADAVDRDEAFGDNVLHQFAGNVDAENPVAALLMP